ncbi:hypothetical protein [Enterovibrio nigricans]|uniref:Outer membrane protein beta-barrel domain-containing protein n=1 Tax=Enterovibrio nigricans DSM 22720 TaxID=1121868 RepID=A0A1T4UT39_9GAMM|nr:hypothetical protein [Enterovibrio nigricans]PKF50803.1 hypothetical protein AT251_08830 [Enterovibrio nigricans]SKA55775.1 hypothetical protein SAMN02745132_02431 [Enterovibrio nigricans DSM 22720]
MRKSQVAKFVFLSLFASASVSANQINGVFGIGYGFGGDELLEVQYWGGDSGSIEANAGISVFGGMDYWFQDKYFARGTIGYKFDSESADNGEVSFDHIPLELTANAKFGNHVLGAGIAYHTAVELECDMRTPAIAHWNSIMRWASLHNTNTNSN